MSELIERLERMAQGQRLSAEIDGTLPSPNFVFTAEEAVARIRELESDLDAANARNAELKEALIRLRDCDWVISLPDRMDAVRDIARAALEEAADG